MLFRSFLFFFFFNDTATTEIYTLSLHDALPIFPLRTGSMIRVFHIAGSSGAQPGFYHVFGPDSCDVAEGLQLVRLYFNVKLDKAAEFVRLKIGRAHV